MSNAGNIFYALDAPFSNFDKAIDEPLIWQTKDFTVQHKFELPIPTLAGSTCKYSFSTKIGDISFSVRYVCPGKTDDTVISPTRVPSDIEPISGSIKSPRDGTLVFVFDNSFSWFNPKLLSYSIELFQPAFTVADSQRCLRSRSLLHTTVEDTRRAELRLIKAQERSQMLRLDIPALEERIAALTADLNAKKSVLTAAMDVVREMSDRIQSNEEKKNGLCIRCLNKKVLSITLSFLGKQSGAALVCKYWMLSLKEST